MKAIILCAGKSSRLYPLTLTRPKPLIKILNKTILEHNLDSLKGIVDEVIIVIGYKKDMIMDFFKNEFNGIKINYVVQKEQLGTGHAVLCAKDYMESDETFLIVPGDDLFSKKDIINCVKHKYAILVKEVDNPEKWGVIVKDNEGYVLDIEEKPENPKSNLANTALWVMDKQIMDIMELQKKTKRDEFEITCALKEFSKNNKVVCELVSDYWLPIGYPWHILEANSFLLKRIVTKINGEIEKNVTLKGDIILEKGAIIKSGAYLEGPIYIGKNSIIGPHSYIRPDTVIEDNCNIRCEVFDSLIMENSTSKHNSYIGHSVIGQKVNIGAGTISADFRNDGKTNYTIINGKKVDSKRRKLGCFIGDGVNTGIGTLIYPGRKLWPNVKTIPGQIITKDIEND